MTFDHFQHFLPAVCAGLGLVLVGVANLLLARCSVVLRALATVAAIGFAFAISAATEQDGAVVTTTRLLALSFVPFLIISSRTASHGLAAIIRSTHAPAIRYGLMTLAGVGTVVGAVVLFERADERANESSFGNLDLMQGRSPTAPTERVKTVTDRGTRVVVSMPVSSAEVDELAESEKRYLSQGNHDDRVIRRGPADESSNCHGWVFTGGQFIVSSDDVNRIVQENGYEAVQEPLPGDLVVYRVSGNVVHTGIVRYVSAGQPVLVESKWGRLGVYLHPAEHTVYGVDFTCYRSSRSNHLLRGLNSTSSVTDTKSTVVIE